MNKTEVEILLENILTKLELIQKTADKVIVDNKELREIVIKLYEENYNKVKKIREYERSCTKNGKEGSK